MGVASLTDKAHHDAPDDHDGYDADIFQFLIVAVVIVVAVVVFLVSVANSPVPRSR